MRKLFVSVVVFYVFFSLNAQAAEFPSFTDLIKENAPAVVNISTTQKVNKTSRYPHGRMPELPDGTPFDDFFKRFFGDEGVPREHQAKSLGSGFIISSDGYVLTNHHVVKDADEVIVRLSDRRELVAEVIGSDKRSDVALLKVEGKGLPAVKLGSSKELDVGEWVLAIGSPFGFDHSVTQGIVSAKRRSLPRENYVPFIQTDVAINPGNSGGPLFDLDGNVVGINSQIYSRTGGFMGLSFAIPIDIAMSVVDQLKDSGQVSRGWLGILIQDVTSELAESFGMKKPIGALVSRVLPDSPAEEGGLEVGDVIMKYNGEELPSSSSLPPRVGATPVDDKATLTIMRKGKVIKKEIVIGELPQDDDLAQVGKNNKTIKIKRLDITVTDLTDSDRENLKLDERDAGVIVHEIKQGVGTQAGLRKGDVISMVNNKDITSAKQLRKLVDKLTTNRSIPVLVQRKSGPVFLALKLNSKD